MIFILYASFWLIESLLILLILSTHPTVYSFYPFCSFYM